MALVPGYDNDIFVSYAHVDNVPLPGVGEGWVSTLMSGLKTRLAQLLGRSGDLACCKFSSDEIPSMLYYVKSMYLCLN